MTGKNLYILWTSGEALTAEYMVMMYATNSMLNGWWKNVTVIIWGAAAKLAAENETIQEKIDLARYAGVEFSACVSCARQLGVEQDLDSMGIELIKWGDKLTEVINSEDKLISV